MFADLYEMSSGISTKPEQAGIGAPFVSFSTIFNNVIIPDELPDKMDTDSVEQEKYSVQKGDILLTRTSETLDELGMSCVAVKDYKFATFSGFAKRLRPTQTDLSYAKYMAFYLRAELFRKTIDNKAVMTLRASLNEKIFSYLELYLPPIEQQKKIGNFLYAIEERLVLSRKIQEKILDLLNLKYKLWFEMFDFEFGSSKHYRADGGKFVYSNEVGKEIPKNWSVKKLSDVVDLRKDSMKPELEPETIFNYYSIPVFDKTKTYGKELGKQIKSNKYQVKENDILVSKLNPRFNRVIYSDLTNNQICSTEFLVWRSSSKSMKNFLYLLATSDHFITHNVNSASGTSNSHKRVKPDVMMGYEFAYNEDVVLKFGEVTGPYFKKLLELDNNIDKLTRLKEYLVPLFIKGQLEIL